MIAALLTILFLGGGGTTGEFLDLNTLDNRVEQAVPDDDAMRRSDALKVVKDMKSRNKSFTKSLKNLADELDKAMAAQKVSDDDLDLLWNAFMNDVELHEDVLIEQRFRLKNKLTREEWATVMAADSDA